MKNRPVFQPKITKEEINRLPVEIFSGKIVVVDTTEKEIKALNELSCTKIIGLDTETKPSFRRGIVHKISLLQVATENVCYLFRLHKIGLSVQLRAFLSNPDIIKVGLSLRDDLNGLLKQQNFKPQGFVDIQHIVLQYGILELSLQKVYAIIFGKKISKSQRLSNWEQDELSSAQQQYAAIDAWATRQIYLRLETEQKLSASVIKLLVNQYQQAAETNDAT